MWMTMPLWIPPNNYKVPRFSGFEDEFLQLLKAIDPLANMYGIDYENDTFSMNRYRVDEFADNRQENFHYKPTNLKIWWHKFAFLDAYSNKRVTLREFIPIMEDCIESVHSGVPEHTDGQG